MSISTVVKSIQDIMRKDAGVDGDAQRIGQMAWLLFLKIFDAQEEELKMTADEYTAPIPQELLWRNWASNTEGPTGEDLLKFINDQLFPQLKNLDASINLNPRGYVVKEAFSDAFNYMKNGTLLRQVVNKINEIDFLSYEERHLFGDIYEKILKDLQSAGNAGEFYTPRAITQFMVKMIDPQLGESIMDPACGTGGFLTSSVEHIRENYVKNVEQRRQLQYQIFGYEKKQLPHLLCVTNLLLHGIEVPSEVKHDNTLSRPLKDWSKQERKDVIVTNPPFGGMEEDGIEKNFPKATQTRETADLFLQLIIRILKPYGRAAIVLPDGTLFGEGVKTKIKEKMLTECDLHTIVRLPNSVFAPYTGIKTNLLFFEKGPHTKEIWYYEHQLPTGVKAYNKTKPMRVEEFDACQEWWGGADRENRKESDVAWKVGIEEIIANNYNLDVKNPHVVEEDHGDPDELLKDYFKQQDAIHHTLDRLKSELSNALSSATGREV